MALPKPRSEPTLLSPRNDEPQRSRPLAPVSFEIAEPPRRLVDSRASESHNRRRRTWISPLTWRILTVNVIALAILVGGLMYLDQYEESLVETELDALRTQGEIFAGALGEGAAVVASDGGQSLKSDVSRQMLRRLVQPTRTRARLFDIDGTMIADSRYLEGPGGSVQIEPLPPPSDDIPFSESLFGLYDWVIDLLPGRADYPPYYERADQLATDYPETVTAVAGEAASSVRVDEFGNKILIAAVPVQRFKKVLGTLLLTTGSADIEAAIRQVRIDILKAFAIALGVTTLLSLYLANAIARPVRRLAAAADRVRTGHGQRQEIPDFAARRDEIGDLSAALREMTDTLWQRLEAIESFAADVAHEIKNPLTSLRSAVETAARISDPEQQRRLMQIILEDVQRLDRLITDISDASRLDAELARIDMDIIDIGRLLRALVQVHDSAHAPGDPTLTIKLAPGFDYKVLGNEDRLVQVFQNLISNAFSFSPRDGEVRITIARRDDTIEIVVEDQGPGIPEGSLEKIFERFYSERPEGEQFGRHSGLGLSISRQIVEAHDGRIRAANAIGRGGEVSGARFTVWLPAT